MHLLYDNMPTIKKSGEYALNLLKWIVFSLVTGAVCGLAGALFHYAVDEATHYREQNPNIMFLLPVAGIIIVFLYRICKMENDKGTNSIIQSVRTGKGVTILTAPLILVSTALTHLCGGSSGREGAALQIGGSIGSFIAKLLRLKPHNTSIMIMCGMSAVFSAVFGTPLTAAVFSLEVVSVGIMHYGALFPSVMSALVAFYVASFFGVKATTFSLKIIPELGIFTVGQIIVLSALAALVSILFITVMHKSASFFGKHIENKYLRALVGSALVIVFTSLVGNYDYNGAGMDIIVNAVESGTAAPEAFILKIFLTAITLAAGFKGGEIVPTFFVGATFGAFAAEFIGLDPSFAAAIGLIALFCGVVNCPVASIFLSIELFGSEAVLYFAIAAAVSYIFSGKYSLYSTQKIMYSKLYAVFAEEEV